MVFTRQQKQKQREQQQRLRTEARPDEEDSTVARWPPPAPCSHRRSRGCPSGVDWASLPDSCLLRVFDCLYADKATVTVSSGGT